MQTKKISIQIKVEQKDDVTVHGEALFNSRRLFLCRKHMKVILDNMVKRLKSPWFHD